MDFNNFEEWVEAVCDCENLVQNMAFNAFLNARFHEGGGRGAVLNYFLAGSNDPKVIGFSTLMGDHEGAFVRELANAALDKYREKFETYANRQKLDSLRKALDRYFKRHRIRGLGT